MSPASSPNPARDYLKGFVLAPAYDSVGRKDSSGAFKPEARAWVAVNQVLASFRLFDNLRGPAERRTETRVALQKLDGARLDVVAIFSHGWRDGIQAGYLLRHAPQLAELIGRACKPDPVVILYACDAGRDSDNDRADDRQPGPGGEGGFASVLAQALWARGCRARLFAHATEGHTTWNPFVRVWELDATPAAGDWAVEPRSPLWGAWVRALRETSLRLRFPFMSSAEIAAELLSRSPAR